MDHQAVKHDQKLTILFHHALEHHQFLKNLSKWIIPVAIISFLFSHSPLLPFIHSHNLYFSTFPFQLFTHTLDKNYMFILCNGLLVFVAKYSGLIRSLSGLNQSEDETTFKYRNEYHHAQQSQSSVLEFKELPMETQVFVGNFEFEKHVPVMVDTQNDYSVGAEEKFQSLASEEEIMISPTSLGEEEVVILEEETQQIFCVENDEEEEILMFEENDVEDDDKQVSVEEQVLLISTEELNKKFDEFIRRMKEDLRLEARISQLVMV